MNIVISGIEEVVRAEVEHALGERRQGWLNSERAAEYLSTTPEVIRDLVRRNGLPTREYRRLSAWVSSVGRTHGGTSPVA